MVWLHQPRASQLVMVAVPARVSLAGSIWGFAVTSGASPAILKEPDIQCSPGHLNTPQYVWAKFRIHVVRIADQIRNLSRIAMQLNQILLFDFAEEGAGVVPNPDEKRYRDSFD